MENIAQYPYVHAYSDEINENLNIEIDLHGVDRENIVFKMDENSFFVKAKKNDVEYVGTYPTFCSVEADRAVLEYHNGILVVKVPKWT